MWYRPADGAVSCGPGEGHVWDELPPEILEQIARSLPPRDAASFGATSKRIRGAQCVSLGRRFPADSPLVVPFPSGPFGERALSPEAIARVARCGGHLRLECRESAGVALASERVAAAKALLQSEGVEGDKVAERVVALKVRGLKFEKWADDRRALAILLGQLPHVASLNLSRNQIDHVPRLDALTKLTHLDLSNNEIVNVPWLTDLTHLDLSNNLINSVIPLEGLTNLNTLNLNSNQIYSVHPLKGLVNLTELNLGFNQIGNLDPLKGLTDLTHLDLSNNQIDDVSPLNNLANLTVLKLWANDVTNVSALAGLPNLNVFM